jgi:signal transduction histidine kinase
MSPGDVNDILQRTFKLLGPDVPPGVVLDLRLAESLPRVSCDAEQLKQVFLNLALNAFQAMPQGGRLTVTTRRTRDELTPWRETPAYADGVEVRFHDTGPGVPADARENIFVPFYTTKEKGTGLGLAISQRIVKAHQGSITVFSATGRGAEFVISLPGIPEERAAEPESPPALPAPASESRRRRERKRRT